MFSGAVISFIVVFPLDTISIDPVFEYKESALSDFALLISIFLSASAVRLPFDEREFIEISEPAESARR